MSESSLPTRFETSSGYCEITDGTLRIHSRVSVHLKRRLLGHPRLTVIMVVCVLGISAIVLSQPGSLAENFRNLVRGLLIIFAISLLGAILLGGRKMLDNSRSPSEIPLENIRKVTYSGGRSKWLTVHSIFDGDRIKTHISLTDANRGDIDKTLDDVKPVLSARGIEIRDWKTQ